MVVYARAEAYPYEPDGFAPGRGRLPLRDLPLGRSLQENDLKILSLHLSNYLSYEDATFDFAPLTVIRGENGAGKTSIEQALQIALAGF